MLVTTGGLDTAVLIWDRLVVSQIDEPGSNPLQPSRARSSDYCILLPCVDIAITQLVLFRYLNYRMYDSVDREFGSF